MRHEYFARRIQKQIERSQNPKVEPTFQGDFLPDVVNTLKDHLRKIELAQIRSVQEYKETIRSQRTPGYTRPTSKVWQQILNARKAGK